VKRSGALKTIKARYCKGPGISQGGNKPPNTLKKGAEMLNKRRGHGGPRKKGTTKLKNRIWGGQAPAKKVLKKREERKPQDSSIGKRARF